VAFEEFLTSTNDWFMCHGPSCGTVVSSRVRLARNIEGKKFPNHASSVEQKEIVTEVEKAILALPIGKCLKLVHLNEISSLDRQFLTEHQLISLEHAAGLGERAVAFEAQEGLSILVNEEDHLRLQVYRSGLSLKEGFQFLSKIDDDLGKQLTYAKDPQLGYLTACPTNLGSALRASVMLHLPALAYTNRLAQVFNGVNQVGLTVRGIQGETTQVASVFFQISNQSSLGKKNSEVIEHVDRMARQIVELELQTQKAVFQQEGIKIEDRICRALGTLKNAKLMSIKEAMDGLSAIRVGVEHKILSGIDLPKLNHLLILIQPAHLAKIAARELNPEHEAMERARILGLYLKSAVTV
jgi:protein arginine kinase